jgi:hypothetical protein
MVRFHVLHDSRRYTIPLISDLILCLCLSSLLSYLCLSVCCPLLNALGDCGTPPTLRHPCHPTPPPRSSPPRSPPPTNPPTHRNQTAMPHAMGSPVARAVALLHLCSVVVAHNGGAPPQPHHHDPHHNYPTTTIPTTHPTTTRSPPLTTTATMIPTTHHPQDRTAC